ncbi:MAG: DUF4276 family protein [Thermoguttaceae bacterium]|jgi:hypothetical protein|nr:DUF4276 family protein [Thermoguttaceae bacterium]
MMDLHITLVSDGSSDQVLLHHLRWLLRQHLGAGIAIQAYWADLRALREKPRTLADRIVAATTYYPCDLLFVHRDAEGQPPQTRRDEIERAIHESGIKLPVVAVVPVRMTEAWLLFSESAVRRAAGNPNGRMAIPVPHSDPEGIADPKVLLHNALRSASGLSGRRLRRFDVGWAVHRVADYIEDFSPLRALTAFRTLEDELVRLIQRQGWT